jgi:2-polyprenyl-3-methyl-5-hydroxy-6-metoxy-1,4-benzoquinol methylase
MEEVINTSTTPIGSQTMSSEMKFAKNYYYWLYKFAKRYIGNKILDVGCGFGSVISYLEGKEIFVLDISLEVIQAFINIKNVNIKTFYGDITSEDITHKLIKNNIDTIICFNVLEHIKDDILALRNMYKILNFSKGYLIIVVPAHKILYGRMDKMAGHWRRYSKKEIITKLRTAGFKIIDLFYFNYLGFFGWFINSKIFRPKSLSTKVINSQIHFYNKIIPIIFLIERLIKLPFGQSLFVVGKV